MLMKKLNVWVLLCFCILFSFASCKEDKNNSKPPEADTSTFAKGADVSWLTEMEAKGVLFYDKNGVKTECMALLKSLGMNSIRLRVWVNPANGWNNKADLLLKAQRAKELGMRIMIDFHYSDTWADPGHQTKPAAWTNLSFTGLKDAVSSLTSEILTTLKNLNIIPEWVQVGNETGNGFLWDEGKASVNMAQYAVLNNTGYDAVKAVYPDTKVIVHLHGGQDNSLYHWLFDGLKVNGGKWDVIGMSLDPTMRAVSQMRAHSSSRLDRVGDLFGIGGGVADRDQDSRRGDSFDE
ncbi:MAG: arabinogalactan endo-1,4-beta-galactosidase, partial [Bacteroidetes bacterium]|nr:arabinogalactan endo-1,4-beta-galactosidase [Bacteroidota bacterium]